MGGNGVARVYAGLTHVHLDIFIYAGKTFLLFILLFDRVWANTAAYANIFAVNCILLSFTAIYIAGNILFHMLLLNHGRK